MKTAKSHQCISAFDDDSRLTCILYSRFLEIKYKSCSYQLNEPKAAGGHVVPVRAIANRINLFIFAQAIYDAFNANSMVTVMLYR